MFLRSQREQPSSWRVLKNWRHEVCKLAESAEADVTTRRAVSLDRRRHQSFVLRVQEPAASSEGLAATNTTNRVGQETEEGISRIPRLTLDS